MSGHGDALETVASMQDVVKARWWTLSALLNRWYATSMNHGSFHWRTLDSYWCKIRMIRDFLHSLPSCDWVAWIDSDAFFATSEAIEMIINAHAPNDILLPHSLDIGNFTAHFMLFKANARVRQFFDLVWHVPYLFPDTAESLLHERFHDQSVINLIMKREVPVHLPGLKVARLTMTDFGQLNSRVVAHLGGLKHAGFHRRLVTEVIGRARHSPMCQRDVVCRLLRHEVKNATVKEMLARHQDPWPSEWPQSLRRAFV